MTTTADPTPDGILVVDKPAGWTSHDVVARGRRLCATRKVGHAGTLDPMATGVLVLGVGRATRLLGAASSADKEYLATIRLGAATTTDDAEGEVIAVADAAGLAIGDVAAAMADFVGRIEQRPSSVSAIKVDGHVSQQSLHAGLAGGYGFQRALLPYGGVVTVVVIAIAVAGAAHQTQRRNDPHPAIHSRFLCAHTIRSVVPRE